VLPLSSVMIFQLSSITKEHASNQCRNYNNIHRIDKKKHKRKKKYSHLVDVQSTNRILPHGRHLRSRKGRSSPHQRNFGVQIQLRMRGGNHHLLAVILTLRGFTGQGQFRLEHMSYIRQTKFCSSTNKK
jgi:hypothetical protein